jgi:hypothetical protein
VAEYRHGTGDRQGETVIGGHVYSGPVDSLRGLYIFADFIDPNVWSVPIGRLVVGSTLPASEFTVRNADFAPGSGGFTNIVSFGVDSDGNLYLVDLDGEIFVIERAAGNTPTAVSFGPTRVQSTMGRLLREAMENRRREATNPR